jgi:glycosyltransferase involved in cell wall biosynthesis
MSSASLFSVVIPTRDAGADIDACLGSLRAQTYRGYEVCVVDALSADGTADKARAQAGGVGLALSCVSEPDTGVYDAMNKGIARARGEWLYFLGADDVLHDPGVLADVAGFIAATGADLVYGDVIEKHAGTRYGGPFDLERLLFECNLCHQAVFYRRALFERLGAYDTRYPVWADWEFNIRCFRAPETRARRMDRLIAVYNERSGVSRVEDPVFSRELPATRLRGKGLTARLAARLGFRMRRLLGRRG